MADSTPARKTSTSAKAEEAKSDVDPRTVRPLDKVLVNDEFVQKDNVAVVSRRKDGSADQGPDYEILPEVPAYERDKAENKLDENNEV